MYSKHKKGKFVPVLLACTAVLVLLGSGIRAKYVTSVPLAGTVTIKGELADNVTLTEHEAKRNDDGSYSLTETIVPENQYVVMPGVDIPKDPTITIENKSSVPAYLYVEVVPSLLPPPDTVVQYALTGDWEKITVTDNTRNVYVYKQAFSEVPLQEIQILKDNKIIISEKYDPMSAPFSLQFHAYMVQKEGSLNATELFNSNFPTKPTT